MKLGRKRRPLVERFWPKVQKGPDCWEWTACRFAEGYGHIGNGGREGKGLKAHRVSWELAYGPIPEGSLVLHRCDNPPCVRPTHLFLGTQQENVQDMIRKGRRRHPDRYGEKNPLAKLTNAQVRVIRAVYAAREYRQQELADMFEVDQSAVSLIILRKTYVHV